MKKIDLLPRLTQAKSKLWDEIVDTGLGKILLHDDIEDYITSSYMYDPKYLCMWIASIDEVMDYAHDLTLISTKEFEDFNLHYLLGIKREKEIKG